MVSNSSTFTLNMTESVKVGFKELIEKDRFEKIVSALGFISPRPPPPGWKRSWWPNPAGLAPTGTITCLNRTCTSCPGTCWIEAWPFSHQEPECVAWGENFKGKIRGKEGWWWSGWSLSSARGEMSERALSGRVWWLILVLVRKLTEMVWKESRWE